MLVSHTLPCPRGFHNSDCNKGMSIIAIIRESVARGASEPTESLLSNEIAAIGFLHAFPTFPWTPFSIIIRSRLGLNRCDRLAFIALLPEASKLATYMRTYRL